MAAATIIATAVEEPTLAPSFLVPSILPHSGQIVLFPHAGSPCPLGLETQ